MASICCISLSEIRRSRRLEDLYEQIGCSPYRCHMNLTLVQVMLIRLLFCCIIIECLIPK